MIRAGALLLLCAVAAAIPSFAAAERIVAALSRNRVELTTTFAGSEIFVFGAVKREAPPRPEDAPLDVVVAVAGPSNPVLVRRKARTFGVWTNAEALLIDEAPSFYAVAATGPLEEVLTATENLRHRVGIEVQVRAVGLPVAGRERDAFTDAVIRLRREAGLYVEAPRGVTMAEDTLFTARFALPANLVEGEYRARTFLIREGEVIDVHEDAISVDKEGFERWLYRLSREASLLYGLLSIAIALAAGWLASEAFRLLRR